MNPTEEAQAMGEAISTGLDGIAHIRSLRAEPRALGAEEIVELRDALEGLRSHLEALGTAVRAGRAEASPQLGAPLLGLVERLLVALAALSPGAALPGEVLDLADAAWAAFSAEPAPSGEGPT